MRRPTNFESGTAVIFGGSFDPITLTHIQVAVEALHFGFGDQVWLVPCGMRPDKDTNVNPQIRLDMVSIGIENMIPENLPIFVLSTEVDSGRYIPTRELMVHYRKMYPKLNFKLLMGNDLLGGLHTWDDFHELISENKFIIYNRICTNDSPRHRVLDDGCSDVIQLLDDAKSKLEIERLKDIDGMHPATSNISSTEVRKRLETWGPMSIVGLTPLPVIDYIISNNLYRR